MDDHFPTYDSRDVRRLLDPAGCIGVVREAMAALSASDQAQPLRNILEMAPARLFGLMPGTLPPGTAFGAKLVSVFGDPAHPGRSAHQGVVVLFDGESGAVRCVADAAEITRIRTGCASAVATDALARADARTLAIFGTGEQAASHAHAIACVRPLARLIVWGRSADRADALAERLAQTMAIPVTTTADGAAAAAAADIICTVTGSREPVLLGDWVKPGTHVNLVGSSYLGPVEADSALVAKSRYFVDYRPSALAAAAELAVAREAGVVGEDHIAAEIGEVLSGSVPGRRGRDEITLYKSLGHVVQDLAAAEYLHAHALREAAGA